MNKINNLNSSANSLLNELETLVLKPEETPTTEEDTQQSEIVGAIIVIVIGGAIVIIAIVKIVSRFMRKRKWDELG
jgi:uncharacterized protein (DUF2062 family)